MVKEIGTWDMMKCGEKNVKAFALVRRNYVNVDFWDDGRISCIWLPIYRTRIKEKDKRILFFLFY